LPGVCRRTDSIAGFGESCGGFTRPEDQKICNEGLVCVIPDQDPSEPQIADLSGVCQKVSATATSTVSTTGTIDYPINVTDDFDILIPTATVSQIYPSDVVVGSASTISQMGLVGFLALLLL
jgi:hypothetical protein